MAWSRITMSLSGLPGRGYVRFADCRSELLVPAGIQGARTPGGRQIAHFAPRPLSGCLPECCCVAGSRR